MDVVLASDKWSVFENLSELALFDGKFVAVAKDVIRRSRARACAADTAAILERQPYCTCSFTLERYDPRRNTTRRLETIIDQGLAHFAARLNERRGELTLGRDYDAADLAALSAGEVNELRSAAGGDLTTMHGPATEGLRSLSTDDFEDWEIDELPVFAGRK